MADGMQVKREIVLESGRDRAALRIQKINGKERNGAKTRRKK
jgi:hypothetical protein